MPTGWDGTPAKHDDGRTGVIRAIPGWCWVDLLIEDAGVEIGRVQLAVDQEDQGESGWSWRHGDRWIPLGKFSSPAGGGEH